MSIINISDDAPLSQAEINRYSRHLTLPNVGISGQRKLKNAKVLLIGAGGLGAPLAMYLSAAGIGTIGLVEYDTVDVSNLQRQVLYTDADIGAPKVTIAKARMQGINPHITIHTYEEPLTSHNALDIFEPYDIIIDGTDNFPTRYLVNDACVLLGKPNVYGSIFRFEGQLSVFYAKEGPCYRCLYPEPPPPGLVPSCAEGGVLGVLPGQVGTLQALEAVKLIVGIGEPMIGRLLLVDTLDMSFTELKLRKNPDCVVCGAAPTVTELIDYEAFCGTPAHDRGRAHDDLLEPEEKDTTMQEMTPQQLKDRLDAGDDLFILDVREPHEWEISNLESLGAVLIPQDQVLSRIEELDAGREMVVHCRTGGRSRKIINVLSANGFDLKNMHNLAGGINEWARKVDDSMHVY